MLIRPFCFKLSTCSHTDEVVVKTKESQVPINPIQGQVNPNEINWNEEIKHVCSH